MGIPEFYGDYLRKNSQGVITNVLPQGAIVHSVAIDTPGIIHAAAQKTWLYGSGKENYGKRELDKAIESLSEMPSEQIVQLFFNEITDKILEIVASFAPRVLILAIDGRAPVAKIQQQRKRRYGAKVNAPIDEVLRFDSAALSPGTQLMKMLDNHLMLWIKRSQQPVRRTDTDREGQKKTYNEAVLPGHVIYSSYRVPGEAEHKIMDIYYSGQIDESPIGEDEKDPVVHVLYGKDADLILLSLIAPINNIIVVRESYTDLINIEALKESLGSYGISPRDFVTIMSFVGNDFLPRQPSMKTVGHAVDEIMGIYTKTKTEYNRILQENNMEFTDSILSDNQGIIWASMSIFIRLLAEKEISFFGNVIANNDKFRHRSVLLDRATETTSEGISLYPDKYRELWYNNALGPKGDLTLLKELLGDEVDLSHTQNDIDHMCKEYLLMFSWVHRYYMYGDCKWSMYYPYHYAPLLKDLDEFLKSLEGNEADETLNEVVSETPLIKGNYNMLHQLLAILPPSSKDLIPESMRSLMGPYSFISDMFPEEIFVDRDGTRSEMMYVYVLPFAELDRIMYTSQNYIATMSMSDWEEYDVIPSFKYDYGIRRPRLPRGKEYWNLRRGPTERGASSGRGESSRGRGRGESSRGRASSGRASGGRGRGGSFVESRDRGRYDSGSSSGSFISRGPARGRGSSRGNSNRAGSTTANYLARKDTGISDPSTRGSSLRGRGSR